MIGFNHAPELLILLIIAFLVFGPEKLPELARGAGRGLREFRKMSSELQQSISTTFQEPLQEVQQMQQEFQQQVQDMTRMTQETIQQSWTAPVPPPAPVNPVVAEAQHADAPVAPVADVPEAHTASAPSPGPAAPTAAPTSPSLVSGAGGKLTVGAQTNGHAAGGQSKETPVASSDERPIAPAS